MAILPAYLPTCTQVTTEAVSTSLVAIWALEFSSGGSELYIVESMHPGFIKGLVLAPFPSPPPPPEPPTAPPPPPKGIHLADEDAAVHFGPNFECQLGFDVGPPPKIVSSCAIDQP